jgi:ketosteroid isomerase-like protein
MREYYADVERAWEALTLFAEDYRAIPGAVVVMGHVEGRIGGEPVRRGAVWTWKVRDGKATEVRVADLGPAA